MHLEDHGTPERQRLEYRALSITSQHQLCQNPTAKAFGQSFAVTNEDSSKDRSKGSKAGEQIKLKLNRMLS